VSAKDKASGKENTIRIQASSGLSEEEIQRMVKDAEANAAEDHKAVELATARNAADGMIHSVKKTLAEHGDKVSADEKAAIETALKEAEDAVREGDKDTIEAKTNALATASHKIAEQMHQAEQANAQPAQAAGAATGEADDNVVDAEFEEVKDK
jgi:molecular chaperone DnaK